MLAEDKGRMLKTTRTSLHVLELVLEHGGLTLAELDKIVDKPKSSLHSHLTTLRNSRYLVRDGNTYKTSYRLALLGEQSGHRQPAVRLATAIVEHLAETTGEEANFTVFEHGRLLLVHGSSGQTPSGEAVGFRTEYYLHNTAAGKAILAEMDRERVEWILDEWGLPRETDETITDREELFEALTVTAERGYGIVEGESAPGMVAVGAPVHHPDGSIVGGFSLGGPAHRIDAARLHRDIVDALRDAVESMERELAA